MKYKKSDLITPEIKQVVGISLQEAFGMLIGNTKQILDGVGMILDAHNDMAPIITAICYGMTKTIPGFKDQMLKRISLHKLLLLYSSRDGEMLSDLGKMELENLEKRTEANYPGFLETVKLYYNGEEQITNLLTNDI